MNDVVVVNEHSEPLGNEPVTWIVIIVTMAVKKITYPAPGNALKPICESMALNMRWTNRSGLRSGLRGT